MNQEKIKIGVLGAALIAERSILPALALMPEHFELVGLASRSLDKAQNLAAEYGAEAFPGYEALLNDESINAVYIPLPNALHYPWVQRALEAGKHVLCEKSLGCTLEEVQALVALAEARNLALVENFQFRFHQQLQELKTLINPERKPIIGELRTLRCSFGFPPFKDANNIRYQKKLGGGALLDAGAYTLKAASIILGEDLQVAAASLVGSASQEVDIHGSGCLIQPSQGITAHLAFGFDNYYQCGVEIWGSEGRIRTNRLFTAGPQVKPVLEIETKDGGRQDRILNEDHHFVNMLAHFHRLCQRDARALRAIESQQNLVQARLMNDFRIKAGDILR